MSRVAGDSWTNRNNCKPLMPGIFTSVTMASNPPTRNRSQASSERSMNVIFQTSCCRRSIRRRESRTFDSSSTNRMCFFIFAAPSIAYTLRTSRQRQIGGTHNGSVHYHVSTWDIPVHQNDVGLGNFNTECRGVGTTHRKRRRNWYRLDNPHFSSTTWRSSRRTGGC